MADPLVALYRPTGAKELELLKASDYIWLIIDLIMLLN
jgi:hypothetical protein